jgi:hypothetical protein
MMIRSRRRICSLGKVEGLVQTRLNFFNVLMGKGGDLTRGKIKSTVGNCGKRKLESDTVQMAKFKRIKNAVPDS